MGITHAHVATTPADPDYDVTTDDWNDDHVVPAGGFTLGTGGPSISGGAADPEGSVTAEQGSLYLRTTGTFYVKESGSGNTGWREVLGADP